MISVLERIDALSEPDGGCRVWRGSLTHNGYAKVKYLGRSWRAHRLVFILTRGPIPDGLILDHVCRNRACVNPDHLEPVTQRENTLRGDTVPARNAVKVECCRGHAFDEVNTYITPDGRRQCRLCRAAEWRRRYAAKKS